MAGLLKLERCEACVGTGVIRGIFHVMECAGCNGAGLINPRSGLGLPHAQGVEQLRLRLTRAENEVARLRKQVDARLGAVAASGPAADYIGNNKRGAGGAHRTGD